MSPAPCHYATAKRGPSPRRGPSVRRRNGYRPGFDMMEARCLLRTYNVPIDLGTIGAAILRVSATSVNTTTGQLVGSAQTVAGDINSYHPFLWTAGGTDGVPSNPQIKDLGGLVSGGYGRAKDINDSG